jgi:1,4-alpha-glucan branching enzyme
MPSNSLTVHAPVESRVTTKKPLPSDPSPSSGARRFSVWAPNARAASVVLFQNDPLNIEGDSTSNDAPGSADRPVGMPVGMVAAEGGWWHAEINAVPYGTEYLFRLELADGSVVDRIDPRARQVTDSVGRSVVLDERFDWDDDDFVAAPRNEWVIYELHPGTFGGDLHAVVDKLDHLVDLGITAIEIMPVAEFAGDTSWGYNPSLPFAVESSYGGPDAMRRLVNAAHQRGIAVIADVVYNHLGPSDLDLWRFDGWYENDGGGIYFFNDWRAETPWGATRPDYGRQEVRDYLVDNARMWIGEYHCDGLRLDSTINIRNGHGQGGSYGELPEGAEFLRELSRRIHGEFPAAVLIAEDLQREPAVTAHVDDGGLGFDLQWSSAFVHPVREALEQLDDAARDLEEVAEAVSGAVEGERRVIYTESHDEVANGRTRVPAEIDPDSPRSLWAYRRAALGAVLTMTSIGTPMIFQGQEWGDEDWFDDAEALQWSRRDERPGTVALWRDLIKLRTGADDRASGLRGDQTRTMILDDELLVHWRWGIGGAENATVVITNFTANERQVSVPVPASGTWHVILATDWSGYDESGTDVVSPQVDTGPELPEDGSFIVPLNIPPYGAALLAR